MRLFEPHPIAHPRHTPTMRHFWTPAIFFFSLGLAIALMVKGVSLPVAEASQLPFDQGAIAATQSLSFFNPTSAAAPQPAAPVQSPSAPVQPQSIAMGGFKVTEEFYTITGATTEDLRKQVFQVAGPIDPATGERFTAYTRWRVNWVLNPQQQGDRCVPVNPVISGSATKTMPSWNGFTDSLPLKLQWKQFYKALDAHEDGHVAHGRNAYQEIQQTLPSLSAPSCAELLNLADPRGADIMRKWANADREYDQRTNHGATQGAIFP